MSGRLGKARRDAGVMALTPALIARLKGPAADCGPGPNETLCDDGDYARLLAEVLTGKPQGDLWLFAYGSLIWRPACLDAERRPALLRGHHRQFCMWTRRFRATPQRPGLMLALERGGECHGLALRLSAATMGHDLDQVLRREIIMKPSAYLPRWLKLETPQGPLRALGFVINRASPRYTGRINEQETARIIAGAVGNMGSCAEYLMHTVSHLKELGQHGARLGLLEALVERG